MLYLCSVKINEVKLIIKQVMKTKAIICSGIDPFNNEFKYVVYCEESQVEDAIKRIQLLHTEVENVEVVDCVNIEKL